MLVTENVSKLYVIQPVSPVTQYLLNGFAYKVPMASGMEVLYRLSTVLLSEVDLTATTTSCLAWQQADPARPLPSRRTQQLAMPEIFTYSGLPSPSPMLPLVPLPVDLKNANSLPCDATQNHSRRRSPPDSKGNGNGLVPTETFSLPYAPSSRNGW